MFGDKQYVIERRQDGELTVQVVANKSDKLVTVRPLRHVVWHSPTGFEAGYAGSGPADLALSILADYFGERPTRRQLYDGQCRCWAPHQDFKFAFIASMDRHQGAKLVITSDEITSWLQVRKARAGERS